MKGKNGGNRNYDSNNRGSCNTDILYMSDYKWCHGPKCHKSHTQDRVRGVKGSKVLRTRKVAQTKWNTGDRRNMFSYFCSNGCYNDFANANIDRIVVIAPRNEPLETPIDVVKEVRQNSWDNSDYITTNITERGVDTQTE